MLLKPQNKGFTIIEVLIVLVIAAVIMLIVFLAVPALQRNSRNTNRRGDVGRMLTATVEAAQNNNWNTVGLAGVAIIIQAADGVGELNMYPDETIITGNIQLGTVPGSADPDKGNLTIFLNATCNGETTTQTKNRSIAILYRVETASSDIPQCEST